MDGAHKSTRMFPAYTTAELRDFLTNHDLASDRRALIETEIAARDAGTSRPFVVPQIGPVVL